MPYTKNLEMLVNPTYEQMVAREPLLLFSFALTTRHNQLASIADEIIDNLEIGMATDCVDGSRVSKAGTLMWLWSLGAYEVVRTMCQAKASFTSECMERLMQLKKMLGNVRMPDAKMEKPGKRIFVGSNRSPWCEDVENRDIVIGDPSSPYSAKDVLQSYFDTMNSISSQDVLKSHEESYEK